MSGLGIIFLKDWIVWRSILEPFEQSLVSAHKKRVPVCLFCSCHLFIWELSLDCKCLNNCIKDMSNKFGQGSGKRKSIVEVSLTIFLVVNYTATHYTHNSVSWQAVPVKYLRSFFCSSYIFTLTRWLYPYFRQNQNMP